MPGDFGHALIEAVLLDAYAETEYRVDGPRPFVLRIEHVSKELARVHAETQVAYSAYITACNPHSAPLNDADNHQRQLALADRLTRRGLSFLTGVGQNPGPGSRATWYSAYRWRRLWRWVGSGSRTPSYGRVITRSRG
jgi:hypothetical protein